MRKIDIKEIKTIEYGILLWIKEICDNNNIVYYLGFGTLLGAVRHKGFIPWDDDIDIFMTRDNFNRFIDVYKKKESNYEVLYLNTSKKYTLPLPKVINKNTIVSQTKQEEKMKIGVWVDIFILDNIPNDARKQLIFFTLLDKIQYLWQFSQGKVEITDFKSRIVNVMHIVFNKLFNPRIFAVVLDNLSQKYNGVETELFAPIVFRNRNRNTGVFDKKWFSNGEKMIFEKDEFNSPNNYEKVLEKLYGNYMEIPSKENRLTKHEFEAYWKNNEEI